MKPKNRCAEELLVLTDQSQDNGEILTWHPFEQSNTFGEIITAHNLRCQGVFKEKTPSRFAKCLRYVAPILTVSVRTPEEAASLPPPRFGRIKVLLLLLDEVGNNLARLEPLKDKMAATKRPFHLLQLSRSAQAASLAPFFGETSCIIKTDPEISRRQSELEPFFQTFRQTYSDAWYGIALNPFDTASERNVSNEPYIRPRHGYFVKPYGSAGRSVRKTYQAYHQSLPGIVTDVRDTAMIRQLTEEQTVNLGRVAAIQALLLAFILEQTRPSPRCAVSISAIQKSLLEVSVDEPFELNHLERVPLLAISLETCGGDPAPKQDRALARLNLTKETKVAVHFDRPEIWKKLEPVQKFVSVRCFRSDLPVWKTKSLPGKINLSENCFGVHIEESFFRNPTLLDRVQGPTEDGGLSEEGSPSLEDESR